MSNTLKIVIEGVIVYVLMFILDYFASKPKKGKKKEMQMELYYLSGLYGIDTKKIDKKKFLIVSCVLNAFIITTIYLVLVYLVKSILLKVLIGVVLLTLLIIIVYGLLGKYYLWREDKNVQS